MSSSNLKRYLSTASRKPHVLIVGGGYAGLATASSLLRLIGGGGPLPGPIPFPEPRALPKVQPTITILDERDGFFHTMGSPLAHLCSSYAEKAWTPFNEIRRLTDQDVKFLHGKPISVDFHNKILSFQNHEDTFESVQRNISYDYLVSATGLRRSWPVVPRKLMKSEYLQDTIGHNKDIENTLGNIVIVGGGAIGIEVSSEVKHLYPKKKVILIHSRSQLLSSEPLVSDFKEAARTTLQEMGVEVVMNCRVLGNNPRNSGGCSLLLENGETLVAEKAIFCTNKPDPQTDYFPEHVLDKDGYVKVNSRMSLSSDLTNGPDHFAVGDIASWPGIKRVGGALIMGQCAAINIVKRLAAKEQVHSDKSNDVIEEEAKLPPFPSSMALSIGRLGVATDFEGNVQTGEAIKTTHFGDDLGLSKLFERMGLDE